MAGIRTDSVLRRLNKNMEIELAYWKYRTLDAEKQLKQRLYRKRKRYVKVGGGSSFPSQNRVPTESIRSRNSTEHLHIHTDTHTHTESSTQSSQKAQQAEYPQESQEQQKCKQYLPFAQQCQQQQIYWLQQSFFQQQVFIAVLFQFLFWVRTIMAPNLPNEGIMPNVVAASNGSTSSNAASSSGTPPSDQSMTMQTPRLYIPLPGPKTVGAPHFDGTNVTDFLEEWEIFCQDHGLSQSMQVQRMPPYCDLFIGDYIKTLEEYIGRDWKELCKTLRKQYLSQDSRQKYYSRAYLEQYKNTTSDGREGLKNYTLQFRSIAKKLLDKKELDEYTACFWFIQGLPASKQVKVMKKASLKADEPTTYNFDKVLAAAMEMSDEEESLYLFRAKTIGSQDLKELVEDRRQNPIVVTKEEPEVADRKTPSPEPVISKEEIPKDMDSLTKAFSQLALPIQAKVDEIGKQIHRLSSQSAQQHQQHMKCSQQSGQQSNQQPQGNANMSTSYQKSYEYGRSQNNGPGKGDWDRNTQQESDRNICKCCGEWGHYRRGCPHLNKLIESGEVHLNERSQVCWGSKQQGQISAPMPLDRSMRQLDAIHMLLKESQSRGAANTAAVRSIELYDSDSDAEEEDILNNFTYTVSSGGIDDGEYGISASTQDSQGSNSRGKVPKVVILDKNARIAKERAAKEKGVATPKTLRTGEWRSQPIVGNPPPTNEESEGEDTDRTIHDETMEDAPAPEYPHKRVRFQNTGGKRKQQGQDPDAPPKEKNVKLQNILKEFTETNPSVVLEKMLRATIPDITVGDILTSGTVASKLMFKPGKPDVMKKVHVGSARIGGTRYLSDVLYSSASPKAAIEVNGMKVPSLIDTGAEVNLIEEEMCRKLGIPYTAEVRLRVIGVDRSETVLIGICENVDISIGPATVTQTLLVVEKASQPIVLGMPYTSATRMITRHHEDGHVDIIVQCPKTNKAVFFEGAKPWGPKTKFLSYLYPGSEFADLKE